LAREPQICMLHQQPPGAVLADPACAGPVLTEVNPSYDADGSQLDRYLTALTTALRVGLTGSPVAA
jgi:hypothetical protein